MGKIKKILIAADGSEFGAAAIAKFAGVNKSSDARHRRRVTRVIVS